MENPQTDLDINASAQLSILEACRKANPGNQSCFCQHPAALRETRLPPVDEKHPIRPVDVNGINKLAEWYHLLYNNVYGIRACALRLTNTYGPGMRVRDARQTFLGIWVRLLLEGKPIKVFGDGCSCVISITSRLCRALMLAGKRRSERKGNNLGSSEVVV